MNAHRMGNRLITPSCAAMLPEDSIFAHLPHIHIIRTCFRWETGSDYWFSLTDTKALISETGWSGSRHPNREGQGRRKPCDKSGGILLNANAAAFNYFLLFWLMELVLFDFDKIAFAQSWVSGSPIDAL